MTRDEWHAFLINKHTTALLDRFRAENAQTDAELAKVEQARQREIQVRRYLRRLDEKARA